MRLGVKASPRDVARFAGMEGATFVETVLFGQDFADLDALVRAFAGHEVVVHAPFTTPAGPEVDVASADPRVREASIEAWELSLRLAERLDARWVIVHPGGIATPEEATGPRAGVLRADALQRCEDALQRLGDEHGRDRILIENMPDHYHRGSGSTDRSLVGRSWADLSSWRDLVAGFCLDVSHAWLTAGGKTTLDAILTRGADAIRHLHISDARAPEGEGLRMGTGEIPWSRVLPKLEALDVTAVPEIKQGHLEDGDGFRDAFRFLRSSL